MCLRFVFLMLTRITSWLRLSWREEAWKIAEILLLRYQLAVLQRRQPRWTARERGDTNQPELEHLRSADSSAHAAATRAESNCAKNTRRLSCNLVTLATASAGSDGGRPRYLAQQREPGDALTTAAISARSARLAVLALARWHGPDLRAVRPAQPYWSKTLLLLLTWCFMLAAGTR